jgi:hypothetical protein
MFAIVVPLAYIPTSSVQGFLPPALHPCQNLVVVVFLMIAIPTRVKWFLSVVLIFISFMAKDGEYFFHVFFDLWISCIKKVLFHSVAYFFIGSLIWGQLIFLSFLYILFISPLSDV